MVKRKKQHQHSIFLGLGIGIIVVFFLFLGIPKNNGESAASQFLDHEEVGLAKDGEIVEEKLTMLRNQDYEEIKKTMGLEKEFCIYFQDENGNLITIDQDIHALGSPDIKINDQPCIW